ncbi:MAG: nuclear transport factor 2 family protein [Chitinophaga sp.]|uniref:nuclear transport factor 2 family protein n=1 Tax=Chitinophaga sp. TaxID=1869181 RepID=UPI0025C0E445|nr:nuclear transport factor 2 family protein [Chitinophaga sp.]MBV8251605.1 nuclear transport factor 2 family protein [Chitinophaga sp.]
MLKPAFTVVILALLFSACISKSDHNPLKESSTTIPDTTQKFDIRHRDQQQIEKVIYSFAENFDNVHLDKCLELMDDSIRGEVDGVRLHGKKDFASRITQLAESVKNAHYQQRHMISNMQFEGLPNDTVKTTMYSAMLSTDLRTGVIQLMQVGYYKGKLVKKGDKWLIAVLNSLPDSKLVEEFYKEPLDSINKH